MRDRTAQGNGFSQGLTHLLCSDKAAKSGLSRVAKTGEPSACRASTQCVICGSWIYAESPSRCTQASCRHCKWDEALFQHLTSQSCPGSDPTKRCPSQDVRTQASTSTTSERVSLNTLHAKQVLSFDAMFRRKKTKNGNDILQQKTPDIR